MALCYTFSVCVLFYIYIYTFPLFFQDNCVYDKIFPTSSTSLATIQSPDSIIYATPTLNRTRTCSPPSHSEPAATGCFQDTRHQHHEAVVYSAIRLSQSHPQSQSYATLFTSTQSLSLDYSKLHFEQRSHVLSDTSAFSEDSCDVYATVQWHR